MRPNFLVALCMRKSLLPQNMQMYSSRSGQQEIRLALRRTTTGMFISTQHNTVYGFDANSIGSAPMWSRNLGTSTNANDISTARYCSDIPYEEARPFPSHNPASLGAQPHAWHHLALPAQNTGMLLLQCMHFTSAHHLVCCAVPMQLHVYLSARAWCAGLACTLRDMHICISFEPPPFARQGILSTGVISPSGVWYVVANVRNADSSISWVRPSVQGSCCMELQATIAESFDQVLPS